MKNFLELPKNVSKSTIRNPFEKENNLWKSTYPFQINQLRSVDSQTNSAKKHHWTVCHFEGCRISGETYSKLVESVPRKGKTSGKQLEDNLSHCCLGWSYMILMSCWALFNFTVWGVRRRMAIYYLMNANELFWSGRFDFDMVPQCLNWKYSHNALTIQSHYTNMFNI